MSKGLGQAVAINKYKGAASCGGGVPAAAAAVMVMEAVMIVTGGMTAQRRLSTQLYPWR